VFGLCQIHGFVDYVRSKMTYEQFTTLLKAIVTVVGGVAFVVGGVLTATGMTTLGPLSRLKWF